MTVPTKKISDISVGMLPGHCRVECGACFGGSAVFNKSAGRFSFEREHPRKLPREFKWEVTTNALSWGAENPRFLLLGVSKGPNQNRRVEDITQHDRVAFDGLRDTIDEQLRCLGLLSRGETISNKIAPSEQDWAFGSAVRCALGTVSEAGKVEQTKNVVGPLADMKLADSWIRKCVSTFYRVLPSRLEVVVLLSNDRSYVAACCRAFSTVDPSIKMLPGSDVAYGNGKVTFVHVVHPASLRGDMHKPGKGNHVGNWLAGGQDKQGRKMRSARAALGAGSVESHA